jgi:hypothetical protein
MAFKVAGASTRPLSGKTAYWRRVPSSEPPRPVAEIARVIGPAMWPWLKSVQTFWPFEKRVTFEPAEMTVPQASDAGTRGKDAGNGYIPW